MESQYHQCVSCDQRKQSTSVCAERAKVALMVFGVLVVTLNLSLSIYTLSVVHGAQDKLAAGAGNVEKIGSQLSGLADTATKINTMIDSLTPASRLMFNMFPVSIPNLLNHVLRTDFHGAAVNITKLARAVDRALRSDEHGNDMNVAAMYASLVASIAQEVTYLKKVIDPNYLPDNATENNDVLDFVISGVFNIIDFETTNPEPWGDLAEVCMDFVDNFLAVNWSGIYRGQYGQRLSWNVNNQIEGPFRGIFDYCSALANLTSPSSVKEFFLTDLFPKDTVEFEEKPAN